jgi:hypothetical protein
VFAKKQAETFHLFSLESQVYGPLGSRSGSGTLGKAGINSLKRVARRIFTVSDFIEAERNFILDFLRKKDVHKL